MNLWLAPHNDDETLFGSFTLLRYKPHVVTCFRSQVQEDRYGITADMREKETAGALWWLGGPSWQQLLLPDSTPNPAAEESLFDSFENLLRVRDPDNVWAPAVELGGHEQHNLVGSVAREVFGPAYRPYFTYVRGQMRTRGDEVPYEPSWVVAKMRALCCYVSQIALENTRPWFVDDTLREFRP